MFLYKIKIIETKYHRNGVAGNGFDVVKFKVQNGRFWSTLLAIVFEEPGNCAVLAFEDLKQEIISNPYRGDDFELQIRDYLKKQEEAPCSN
jgi:hypothetical protein